MSTEYLQAVASITTSGALIFTIMTFIVTFRRTRKTEQIKLGDKFVSEIFSLRKEMNEVNNTPELPQREFKKRGLNFRIFNTLEWNAFLVNEKEITDQKLICFYKNMFVECYDELLPQEEKDDPKSYPEWKELVENIKKGVYANRQKSDENKEPPTTENE